LVLGMNYRGEQVCVRGWRGTKWQGNREIVQMFRETRIEPHNTFAKFFVENKH